MQFLRVQTNALKRTQPFLRKEKKKAVLGICILTARVAALSLRLQRPCPWLLGTAPRGSSSVISPTQAAPQPPGSTGGPGARLELLGAAAPRTEDVREEPAVIFFSFIGGKRYGIKERDESCQERGWGCSRPQINIISLFL